MKWKVMSKAGSFPGWGDVHRVKRTMRRFPIAYSFVLVLFLILLPQLHYKVRKQVSEQRQKIKNARSVFGDNLFPTPWHWHHNELGPLNQTWDRSLAILKCSLPRWNHPSRQKLPLVKGTRECPSYFHWIAKDLAPWKFTGITPTNIEMAREHAAFKVVILRGRLYVELYYSCVETRAAFTVWGLLMLLEKYEGKIPDVEMMFDCMDRPRIQKTEEEEPNELWSPAPLFRYCSNSQHYDLPWPDWSFWGWPETGLDPWDEELSKIKMGANKKPWTMKVAKAYWRGNSDVGSPMRVELMQCNSATKFPNAEIYNQDWKTERELGKENSKLENQCEHRYKIYAEGFAWSVSFKYIMACGSPTLAISPAYYDFFTRGLVPGVHYVPVRPSEICAPQLCGAIDNAVTNAEKDLFKAIQIGEAGQAFVSNEIGMHNVYDYMYHMIKAYADLQRFKPTVPRKAKEVTQDFILCLAQPHERLLLEKSRDQIPWTTTTCDLPENAKDGVKDFGWEAVEQAKVGWSETNCSLVRTGQKGHKTKSRLKKKKPHRSTSLKRQKNGTENS